MTDLFHNRFELLPFGLIDHIRVVCANHLLIGGYNRHIQFIRTIKLSSLSVRGSCHPSKFFVHPEVVLEGNGGQGLIFFCHAHAFLGFHSLMQAVAPAATRHHTSCELVHNDHLPIFQNIVDILLEQPVCFDKLLGGVEKFRGAHITIFQIPQLLRFIPFTQTSISYDVVAFMIQIGECEITQTCSG